MESIQKINSIHGYNRSNYRPNLTNLYKNTFFENVGSYKTIRYIYYSNSNKTNTIGVFSNERYIDFIFNDKKTKLYPYLQANQYNLITRDDCNIVNDNRKILMTVDDKYKKCLL